METEFPHSSHKGCYFHFTQAIYRQIQKLGLSVSYKEDERLRLFTRYLIATPFLSPSKICDLILHFCNTEIARNVFQDYSVLADLMRYFYSTWILTYPPTPPPPRNVELLQSRKFPENHQFLWKLAFAVEQKAFKIPPQFFDNPENFKNRRSSCEKCNFANRNGPTSPNSEEMENFQLPIGWSETLSVWRSKYFRTLGGNFPLLRTGNPIK